MKRKEMASQFQQRKHIVWTLKSSLPSVLFNLNIYDYPLVCNDLKQAVEILANRYCFKRCTVNEFCYGHTYIVQDLGKNCYTWIDGEINAIQLS